MASTAHKNYDFPGKAEVRTLPTAAHEVSCVLLYGIESPSGTVQNVYLGQLDENVEDLPPVLVRLGTKTSETHTSNIGFRVLLQQEERKGDSTGQLEDNYHLVSCHYVPNDNALTHRVLDEEETAKLNEYEALRGTTLASIGSFDKRRVHTMVFTSDGLGKMFLLSRHGGELQSDASIRSVSKQVQSLAYAKRVLIFFREDHALCSHLDTVIEHDCTGSFAPSWKDPLPEGAVPTWPLGLQSRMVRGSSGPFNVLNAALRHDDIHDGSGTSLSERPHARLFADCVRTVYPSAKREPRGKVFPLMLNVTDGICLDLPFGLSMYNPKNVFAGAIALYHLLRTGIPASNVGIITFYPSQTQAYRIALKGFHHQDSTLRYGQVTVDSLEGWVGKEIDIAIIDFVRTANASGNLGYLSQWGRLKVALTIHRDGFIIVGNRNCTINSQGEILSTKLEKVLEWFSENGRIVDVSMPTVNDTQQKASGQPFTAKTSLDNETKAQNHDFTPAMWTQLAEHRMYVGVPGCEGLRTFTGLDEEGKAPSYAGAPMAIKPAAPEPEKAKESFLRQLGTFGIKRTELENPKFQIATLSKPATPGKEHAGSSTIRHTVKPKATSRSEVQDSFARQDVIIKGQGRVLYNEDTSPEISPGDQTPSRSEPKAETTQDNIQATSHVNPFGAPKPQSGRPSTLPKSGLLAYRRDDKQSGDAAAFDQVDGWKSATKPADLSSPIEAPGQRTSSNKTSGAGVRFASQPSSKVPLLEKDTVKPESTSKVAEPQTLRSRMETTGLEPASRSPRSRPSPAKENTAPISVKPSIKADPDPSSTASIDKLQLTSTRPSKLEQRARPDPPDPALSIRDTNIQQPGPTKQTFKSQYGGKYKALRSLFDTLNRPSGPHPKEDRLFRNLAEALMDEDAQAFKKTYSELWDIATAAQVE
ncbi:hypothetical protein P7C71_g1333, partial [Lecanoromycetidae sp. Uapishka_2]